MSPSFRAFLLAAMPALLFSCAGFAETNPLQKEETQTPPSLTEEGMALRGISWEKPVIIYNMALGRAAAVMLRERLQPYLRETIGLYPCQKEGAMCVPLPEQCTRLVLDLHYFYEGRRGTQGIRDYYHVELGCQVPAWRRSLALNHRCAYPAHVTCLIPRGQEEKVIDLLFHLLRPHMAKDAEGNEFLRPVSPDAYRQITYPATE